MLGAGSAHRPASSSALAVALLVSGLCRVVLGPLFRRHPQQRWPVAEAVENRLAAAAAGMARFELLTAQVRAFPFPLLASFLPAPVVLLRLQCFAAGPRTGSLLSLLLRQPAHGDLRSVARRPSVREMVRRPVALTVLVLRMLGSD